MDQQLKRPQVKGILPFQPVGIEGSCETIPKHHGDQYTFEWAAAVDDPTKDFTSLVTELDGAATLGKLGPGGSFIVVEMGFLQMALLGIEALASPPLQTVFSGQEQQTT
jgi:hypothetical protein